MAERAGLFEEGPDFDVSAFAPKKPAKSVAPETEAIRAVSETANFKSREPVQTAKKPDRRHRTGRNEQLNVKVTAQTLALFYKISDQQKWVLGETLERAVRALQREIQK
jgi:hypothetical protein